MTTTVLVELASSLASVEVALTAPVPVGDFPDYYVFDTLEFTDNPTTPMAPGRMHWNPEEGTAEVGQGFGDAVLQMGRETYLLASNNNGTDIVNGDAVQFAGAGVGGVDLGVALAKADGTVNPYRTLGLATQDIAIGAKGLVTNFGKVHNLNTTGASLGETWAVGDVLYCHPTLPGKLTKVRPPLPAMVISIGAVLKVHATDGIVFVSPRILGRQVYALAHHTGQQNLALANTAQAVLFGTVGASMGVTMPGSGQFVPDTPGAYTVEFTLNVRKTGGTLRKLYVWARVNGVDVPSSSTSVTIQGASTEQYVTGSFAVSMLAGQAFQFMFAANSTEVYLDSEAATAFAPASPSARITFRQLNP